MKKKILIAIPCYNCAPQIPRVLKQFDKELLEKIDKVMIIDNVSSDNTVESAVSTIKEMKLGDKFSVFKNDANYSLGGTHKVAFNYGIENNYDYVGIIHGDDQANVEDMKKLTTIADEDETLTAVLGARFMKNSKLVGYSKIRILGNMLLNIIFSIFSMRVTYDLGSGMNLFKMSGFKDRRYLQHDNGLTFNVDLLLDLYHRKKKVKFTPITWSEEDQVSNAKIFKVGSTMLKTVLIWVLNKDIVMSRNEKIPENYKSKKIL